MANTVRIKRRAAGGAAGAPSSLQNAELAFNEQDDTLYYDVLLTDSDGIKEYYLEGKITTAQGYTE